ncbi:MAG TPA: GMP synthase [Flavisolibacter sp.]|jgi:GMP synthase-like glutamine amidotransferase|nr:GMP synthase [Flavisolibacter sp.]
MVRIAILDLYEGQANQGMRCIRQIIQDWSEFHGVEMEWNEFEVRLENKVPDLSYDIYISSGGPGSPLESEGSDWEKAYFSWLESIEKWNADPSNENKKHVFFICHSFQLVCRHYRIGNISKRNKTSFGVYPVHVTLEGQHDVVFRGLSDPFYVVDSRDYQVTSVDFEKIDMMGGSILCIEKYRPHVPFEQALMGIRFNDYMVGTQFHPEADAIGMSMYLQREDKKQTVIENHGEEKWSSMIEQLNDPDKIMWTYAHVLPNFLNESVKQVKPELV